MTFSEFKVDIKSSTTYAAHMKMYYIVTWVSACLCENIVLSVVVAVATFTVFKLHTLLHLFPIENPPSSLSVDNFNFLGVLPSIFLKLTAAAPLKIPLTQSL